MEEDGWGDDESGSRAPMRVITWKWEKVRAENGKTVIVEREGKLRLQEMDRLLRGAEVQQRAGGEMHQCTPPPLPRSPVTRTTLA